jgi:hypothetical protein
LNEVTRERLLARLAEAVGEVVPARRDQCNRSSTRDFHVFRRNDLWALGE